MNPNVLTIQNELMNEVLTIINFRNPKREIQAINNPMTPKHM